MSLTRRDRCPICGCGSLWTDEVLHVQRWLLAECQRCDHRWTEALPDQPARARRVGSTAPTEVVQAA